jgi:hypothetical protein
MASFTRYLATLAVGLNRHEVLVSDSSPIDLAQSAIRDSLELRYSPIMVAYLIPNEEPPALPSRIETVTLVFSNCPHKTLAQLRPLLNSDELRGVHFTIGLASLVFLNFSLERLAQIEEVIGQFPLEHWPIKNGKVDFALIVAREPKRANKSDEASIQLPSSPNLELRVYTEQICASLQSLWANYGIYFPEERDIATNCDPNACSFKPLYGVARHKGKFG